MACTPKGDWAMKDIVADLHHAIANDSDPWDVTLYERAVEEIERLRAAVGQRDCWEWDCPKCGAQIYSKVLDR